MIDNEDDYFLHGAVGTESHDKIYQIYNAVMKKIPERDRFDLQKKHVVVVLADKTNSFCVPAWFILQQSEEICTSISIHLIVLSPGIVERPRRSAVYTIAHELAHAYLGHSYFVNSDEEAKENEIKADQQVIKWGFKKELMSDPDNYIYGNGIKNVFEP
ncbi:MAG TPA: hypothetical protein DCG53_07490 [Syntrophus sp. (in: bacteria)]|jgi:hypothetical protein|nr:hypothetical protein [Syntrophus sp. (in: bacteria)]